jgi:hypothetical protein
VTCWNKLLARLCCSAKPLKSQLSMLNGTCPIVVDHKLSISAAWKNSIGCGTVSIAVDKKDFASLKSLGANLEARSWVVWRTAIRQVAESNKGELRSSASRVSGGIVALNATQRP